MTEKKKDREKKTPANLPAIVPDDDDAPSDEAGADDNGMAPHPDKVGEGDRNLKRREEWFRKRTGGKH